NNLNGLILLLKRDHNYITGLNNQLITAYYYCYYCFGLKNREILKIKIIIIETENELRKSIAFAGLPGFLFSAIGIFFADNGISYPGIFRIFDIPIKCLQMLFLMYHLYEPSVIQSLCRWYIAGIMLALFSPIAYFIEIFQSFIKKLIIVVHVKPILNWWFDLHRKKY
ncbi:hypothetical protein BpHYR1_045739, partial [Brachionus plicatilis]